MGVGWKSFGNGADGDFSGLMNRIPESSGRDGREGQGLYSVVVGDTDGFAVATSQGLGFALVASAINRANGMNYEFRGQASSGGEDGFTGGKGADFGYDAL